MGSRSNDASRFLHEMLLHPEHLVTAYADGELSQEECSLVEQHLLVLPEHREMLESIRSLQSILQSVATPPVPDRLLETALEHVQNGLANPSPENEESFEFFEEESSTAIPRLELLTAYVDDELPIVERRRVTVALSNDEEGRAFVESEEAVCHWIASLPLEIPPPGLLSKTLARLQTEPVELGNDSVAKASVVELPASMGLEGKVFRTGTRTVWFPRILSALTVAATILLFAGIAELVRNQGSIPPISPWASQPVTRVEPLPAEPSPTSWAQVLYAGETPRNPVMPNRPLAEIRRRRNLASKPRSADPLISFQQARNLKPGDIISTFDRKEVHFVCVDVQQMFDRLRVVLTRHDVSLDPKGEQTKGIGSQTSEDAFKLFVVELTATPMQFREILSSLWKEEIANNLVATVSVDPLDEGLLTDLRKPREATPPQPKLVSRIPDPSPPLANPFPSLPDPPPLDQPSDKVRVVLVLTPDEEPRK